MKKFIELTNQYNNFIEQVPKLDEGSIVLTARELLRVLRDAGRYVIDPHERDILAAWCRGLGDMIYEKTKEYPAVRITPFEKEIDEPRKIENTKELASFEIKSREKFNREIEGSALKRLNNEQQIDGFPSRPASDNLRDRFTLHPSEDKV